MKAEFIWDMFTAAWFFHTIRNCQKQRWSVFFSGGTFPIFFRLAEKSRWWSSKAFRMWITTRLMWREFWMYFP